MFLVGDKIVYGENGVCTVKKVAPLDMSGASTETALTSSLRE